MLLGSFNAVHHTGNEGPVKCKLATLNGLCAIPAGIVAQHRRTDFRSGVFSADLVWDSTMQGPA